MFSKEIGIDLGTANTLVYMKGKGIIIREPSVAAVDIRNSIVKSVGHEAKEVIGRTPGSIVAVRPLKDGVIADFDITTSMLQTFIKRATNHSRLVKPRIVICIPSGVTDVERRAVKESAEKAGAKKVSIIEEPMAAAIGAGLPVAEPTGLSLIHIFCAKHEIIPFSYLINELMYHHSNILYPKTQFGWNKNSRIAFVTPLWSFESARYLP